LFFVGESEEQRQILVRLRFVHLVRMATLERRCQREALGYAGLHGRAFFVQALPQ
jgi:hypothetical protein